MRRAGRRHHALERFKSRLQDSSEDLAEALERAADKYGGQTMQAPKFTYCNCVECGLLVRAQLTPETLELAKFSALQWVAVCPGCKCNVAITWTPPEKLLHVAQPADVPRT